MSKVCCALTSLVVHLSISFIRLSSLVEKGEISIVAWIEFARKVGMFWRTWRTELTASASASALEIRESALVQVEGNIYICTTPSQGYFKLCRSGRGAAGAVTHAPLMPIKRCLSSVKCKRNQTDELFWLKYTSHPLPSFAVSKRMSHWSEI